jgi:hypothetical protein
MRNIFWRRSILALGVALYSLQSVYACINDRDSDTLIRQAKRLPDTVAVISGRFPRNPALYYEMRIQRTKEEIATNPQRLPLYDDIAAAYDRLGNDDAAIQWIEKKHTRLGNTSPTNPKFHEDWYRYYANVGTFRVHRWIRAGADPKRPAELQRARAEIAKAIKIKPNAHFGREIYQLTVMDWLLTKRDKPLALYLEDKSNEIRAVQTASGESLNYTNSVDGISGIIVLGGAWESPDIFAVLSDFLIDINKEKLGFLARMRSQELLDNGRKTLGIFDQKSNSALSLTLRRTDPNYPELYRAKYSQLRDAAEMWQNDRWKYMLTRLHQGQHPDTDPKFWDDWREPTAPSLDVKLPWSWSRLFQPQWIGVTFFVFCSTIAILCFAIRGLIRYRKRQGSTEIPFSQY